MTVEFDELVEAIRVLDQQIREREDRTLLVKIQFEEYPISCEVLDQVFTRFGNIESIEKFDHDAQLHSRICFCNRDSALEAFNCFDGRFIYEDCCLLELSFVAGDRSSSFEAPNQDIDKDPEDLHIQYESSMADGLKNRSEIEEFVDDSLKQNLEASRMDEQKKQRSEFIVAGEVQGWQEEIEASIKVPTLTELQCEPSSKDTKQREMEFESSKVKSDSLYSVWDDAIERKFEVGDPVISTEGHLQFGMTFKFSEVMGMIDVAPQLLRNYSVWDDSTITPQLGILEKMGMIDVAPQETMEIDEDDLANHVNSEVIVESMTGFEVNSMGVFEIPAAHKVFVEMPIQLITGFDEEKISDIAIVDWRCSYLAIFNPGGGSIDLMSRNVADMTKMGMMLCHCVESSSSFVVVVPTVLAMNLVFDPGGMCYLKLVKIVVSYEVDIAGQSILEQNFGQQPLPFNRGKVGVFSIHCRSATLDIDSSMGFVFDPGITEWVSHLMESTSAIVADIDSHRLLKQNLVFDLGIDILGPGGNGFQLRDGIVQVS